MLKFVLNMFPQISRKHILINQIGRFFDGRGQGVLSKFQVFKEIHIFKFFKNLFILKFFPFIFISWRLITLQYCSGFCYILTRISHGFTCIPPSTFIYKIGQPSSCRLPISSFFTQATLYLFRKKISIHVKKEKNQLFQFSLNLHWYFGVLCHLIFFITKNVIFCHAV